MNSLNTEGSAQPVDNRVSNALSQVTALLSALGIKYALIGGLGVAVRGNVRATSDVDILMSVPQLGLPRFLEAMSELGADVDITRSIRDWNDGGMLAIESAEGVQIDFLKPVVPAFHRIIERATTESFWGQDLQVADAEGLVLMKLLAFRPLDQEDIRGILARAEPDLNWIRTEAVQLGVETSRLTTLDNIVQEFGMQ